MLRKRVIRRFCCHTFVCYTQVITLTSADAFPVVGGRCTGRGRRCKARQGCREDGADMWILTSTVVRFWGGVQRRKRFFFGNRRALLLHGGDCRFIDRLPLLTERAKNGLT